MNQYRPVFNDIPPVVKNLIIINVLFLLATWVLKNMDFNLVDYFGMHYPASEKFRLHQVITYMFMHGGIAHLFFNMFALWMFGRVLESVWGSKRFLLYYMVTGIGAIAIQTFVNYLDLSPIQKAAEAFANTPSADLFSNFVNSNQKEIKALGFNLSGIFDFTNEWLDNPSSSSYQNEAVGFINKFIQVKMDIPTVGASGAVFGILLAFGMLFPNTQLMLIFPPIPIRAKYFVMAYGALELYLGLTQPGSSIAHFAHLGGMLFGFFLIKYWNKTRKTFY